MSRNWPLVSTQKHSWVYCTPELYESSEIGSSTFPIKSGPYGKPTVIDDPVHFRAQHDSGTDQAVQFSSWLDCRLSRRGITNSNAFRDLAGNINELSVTGMRYYLEANLDRTCPSKSIIICIFFIICAFKIIQPGTEFRSRASGSHLASTHPVPDPT